MDEHVRKTGTTTIGLVTKDGIVLAADKRITVGNTIAGSAQKIIPIGKRFAVTIAGTASDAFMLGRYLSAEIKLKELRSNNEVTVREAANLLSMFVYNKIRTPSVIPGITHFLIAGIDKEGHHLYDIFPDGSISEISTYYCSGSGSVYAYGLIDASYDKQISLQEGIALAKKGIRSAIIRDSASGNGYDIFSLSEEGVTHVETKVFDSQIQVK